jgi:hypothetical protein
VTYDLGVTATRKFVLTVILFALALGMVGIAAATHAVGPLFGAWAPLLAVPYVLTRPEPGDALSGPPVEAQAESDESPRDDHDESARAETADPD